MDKKQLVCNCGHSENHYKYKDHNKETVIECSECKRFIKKPQYNAFKISIFGRIFGW